jgi:hypothetical protein
MPWGEEYPGAIVVDMYLAELAAHAWDLARATGQINMLDPSLPVPAIEGHGPGSSLSSAIWSGPGPLSGRRSTLILVLTTGNASLPSWDATHTQRSVCRGERGARPSIDMPFWPGGVSRRRAGSGS